MAEICCFGTNNNCEIIGKRPSSETLCAFYQFCVFLCDCNRNWWLQTEIGIDFLLAPENSASPEITANSVTEARKTIFCYLKRRLRLLCDKKLHEKLIRRDQKNKVIIIPTRWKIQRKTPDQLNPFHVLFNFWIGAKSSMESMNREISPDFSQFPAPAALKLVTQLTVIQLRPSSFAFVFEWGRQSPL